MKNNYSGIFPAIPFELALSGMRERSPDGCWLVGRTNTHKRYAQLQGKGIRYELEPDTGWGQMAVEIWPEALDMFLRMFSEKRPDLVKVFAYDTDLTISPYTPDGARSSPWFTAVR
ncbi:hypothetical protein [Nonomuraea sp. NPDC049141]|uniref:hypothetical protein n=1 Tax=Nonomuraea sp. NPDC049141 TaxID=3155500 RepID=UPI0033FDB4F2